MSVLYINAHRSMTDCRWGGPVAPVDFKAGHSLQIRNHGASASCSHKEGGNSSFSLPQFVKEGAFQVNKFGSKGISKLCEEMNLVYNQEGDKVVLQKIIAKTMPISDTLRQSEKKDGN